MKVYIKLHATLVRNVSGAILADYPQGIRAGSQLRVELPEGSTLDDLMTFLALPRDQVKLVFVNARARELDYHLKRGDEVGIFPPIAGG